MVQTVMLKRLGLLETLASLVMDGDDLRFKCVKAHGSILKPGAAMSRALADYQKSGKDSDMRWAKDQKGAVLKGLLKTSSAFHQNKLALQTGFDALRESVEGQQPEHAQITPIQTDMPQMDQEGQQQTAEDAAGGLAERVRQLTLELIAVDSAGCFSMHLTDDVAIDAMLRHLGAREETLQKAVQDLQPVVMTVSGENSWKKDVSSESSLEEVRAAATQLVKMKLKGAPFATSLENVAKDGQGRLGLSLGLSRP